MNTHQQVRTSTVSKLASSVLLSATAVAISLSSSAATAADRDRVEKDEGQTRRVHGHDFGDKRFRRGKADRHDRGGETPRDGAF